MKYQGKDYRTVWLENGRLFIVNQNKLPFKFEIIELVNLEDAVIAIKEMKIRGAPAIGAVAALSYALAVAKKPDQEN